MQVGSVTHPGRQRNPLDTPGLYVPFIIGSEPRSTAIQRHVFPHPNSDRPRGHRSRP